MAGPLVVFDGVSKKFRRGERHDSLRDLLPALVRGLACRHAPDQLDQREFWALRDVSFTVGRGEALGIIGPNGAGKSTTLKLLTRILRPTVGSCHVRGRIGALIEVAAGFHPDLTGRENVFLQGAIMGMKRAEIAARFDEIVEFAGVEPFIDTPVKRYSSGMNARLGFSIAAHLNPDVLIIDEVLSVGDMAFQKRCVERMERFVREGVTIVFVSHNLQAVGALCRSALYLNRDIRAFGRTSDVIGCFVSDSAEQHADTDHEVDIARCELTDGRGLAPRVVAPGAPLTLRVAYGASARVEDFTLGFLLVRSTDRLVVYDANILGPEVSCRSMREGEEMTIDFAFNANVTRGHYHVELHVFHNPTQRFLARVSPAATFAVEETRTYAGIADLQLRPERVSSRAGVAAVHPVTSVPVWTR